MNTYAVTTAALCAAAAIAAAGPVDLPFTDNFDAGTLSPDLWVTVSGGGISASGIAEPSPEFSLILDGRDAIETQPVAANVLATLGQVVVVSFWSQHRGVEIGEALLVEYSDAQGNFNELTRIESTGISQTSFAFNQVPLPPEGYHSNMVVRFTADGNQSNDDWYIDSVRIGAFAGNNPPSTDDFEDGFDQLAVWSDVFNADTPSDLDPNAPSGNTVARLNRDDRIETVDQFLGVQPNNDLQQYVRFWLRIDGPSAGESLRVEYFDPDANDDGVANDPAYKLFEEIVATGNESQSCYTLKQYAIPMVDNTDSFRVRLTSVADNFNDFWLIDDFTISSTPLNSDPNCRVADIAFPCGVVDLDDVDAFIGSFMVGGTQADLVAPFGIVDIDDVNAFISSFLAGCNEPHGEP